MSEPRLTKSNVLAATETFFELAAAHDAEPLAAALRPAVAAYKTGSFRLVVVGEIKKGKSSFVNALLNAPGLLPVETGVATSTAYEVRYSESEKCTVHFNPRMHSEDATQLEEVAPLEIALGDVATYGTETGNPGNKEEVASIVVELPNEFLKSGVTLIDTPGLGGLVASHADITWKQASRADAFCFVLDSLESVVSLPELEGFSKFLAVPEKLDGSRPPFFFVQTKTDAAPDTWESCRERNLENLSAHFNVRREALRYFPISSTLKAHAGQRVSGTSLHSRMLEDSGFPALLDFLNDTLRPEQAERLGRKLLQPLLTATQAIRDRIAEELPLFHASQEEVGVLAQQATATAKGFATWEEEKYPQLVKDFNARAMELREETCNQLQAALAADEDSPIVTPRIQALRNANLGRKELLGKSGSLHAECVEECQDIVLRIFKEYQEKMDTLIRNTTGKFELSLEYEFTSAVTSLRLGDTAQEITMPSLTDNVGLQLSVGIAAMGVAALHLSPFAALGIPIAAIIGCAIIGRHLFKRAFRGEQEALSQLQNLLIEVVQQAQSQAIQQLEESSAAIEGEMQDFLETARAEAAKELARRSDAITSAQAETQAEKRQKADVLEAQIAQAETLLHTIEEMLGQPESEASDPTRSASDAVDELLDRASVNLKAGNKEAAMTNLTEALFHELGLAEVTQEACQFSLDLGRADLADGNYREAITLFENVLALDPDNALAHAGISQGYLNLGELEKAENAARKAAQIVESMDIDDNSRAEARLLFFGGIAAEYVSRGIDNLRKGDESAAIADCEKALSLDPSVETIYAGIAAHLITGPGYLNLGELEKAENAARKAAQIAQSIDIDDDSLADSCAETVLLFFEDIAVEYVNRGNGNLQKGDESAAIADCEKALSLDPSVETTDAGIAAHLITGAAYARMGDRKNASASFTKALDIDPIRTDELRNEIFPKSLWARLFRR